MTKHRDGIVRRVVATVMISGLGLLLFFTVLATQERRVLDNAHLMSDVWFRVTLVDAYIGFAIFYLWVAWKERSLPGRILWFVLIFVLGNMATTLYVLIQMWKQSPGDPVSQILVAGSTCDSSGAAAGYLRHR